jgi:hypothetical protein
MQIAGDIITRNMDWPGAEEIADRMKLMLPPPILQAEQAKEQGQDPKVMQAVAPLKQALEQSQMQMQQMQQALQEAGQRLQGLEQEKANKQSDAGLKVEELKIKRARRNRSLSRRDRADASPRARRKPGASGRDRAANGAGDPDELAARRSADKAARPAHRGGISRRTATASGRFFYALKDLHGPDSDRPARDHHDFRDHLVRGDGFADGWLERRSPARNLQRRNRRGVRGNGRRRPSRRPLPRAIPSFPASARSSRSTPR